MHFVRNSLFYGLYRINRLNRIKTQFILLFFLHIRAKCGVHRVGLSIQSVIWLAAVSFSNKSDLRLLQSVQDRPNWVTFCSIYALQNCIKWHLLLPRKDRAAEQYNIQLYQICFLYCTAPISLQGTNRPCSRRQIFNIKYDLLDRPKANRQGLHFFSWGTEMVANAKHLSASSKLNWKERWTFMTKEAYNLTILNISGGTVPYLST